MKRIKPLNDYVVLRPIQNSTNKVGNIIVPDLGNEKPILAEVVALSEGIYNWRTGVYKNHEIKIGDTVVIPKLGSQVITIDNEEFYLCQSQQLLAVLNNDQ